MTALENYLTETATADCPASFYELKGTTEEELAALSNSVAAYTDGY